MKSVLLATITVLLAANTGLSQGSPSGFDAVSIRPAAPDARGGGFNLSPGRLNAKNRSLKDLIQFAYDLHDYQVTGLSGWMDTERYEIVATFPGATTEAQRAQMMQALLTDRFALATHRETKEVQGYALIVGKNEPKLRKPESAQGGMMLGRNPATGQRTLTATSAKMPDFASMLATLLGRPVADKTGIEGAFDFSMEWTPDPVGESSLATAKQDPGMDASGGPSIFTALQQMVGLKLETAKAAMEVMVIDHAERPSVN